MWLLLVSPFVTAIFSFLILNGFMPKDNTKQIQEVWLFVTGFLFSLWMLIGFCICSGVFVLSTVSDREFRLRYLMSFVGLKSFAYYIGNMLCDFILFLIPTIFFIILLFPMKIDAFTSNWATILAIMCSFGFSLISLSYFVGFAFSNSNSAFR